MGRPIIHLKDELRPAIKRRYWLAQRAIWALMAVFLALAIAGVFGSGLFSDRAVSRRTGELEVRLEYERFARFKRPQHLTIQLEAPSRAGDQLTVVFSPALAGAITVKSIVPDADSTAISGDGAIYEWTIEDWSAPVTVHFELQAEQWRRIDGRIGVHVSETSAQDLPFSQFVYP